MSTNYTVAGVDPDAAKQVAHTLQDRLNSLIDLQLTLKHVHWNLVGLNFIAVHEMLDPQVDAVRQMSDRVAERIATLGQSPQGTPGAVVRERAWDDYSLGRASVVEHLAALDVVYDGIVADHRKAVERFDALDLVSQGLLIEQLEELEKFQWFLRAHLEDSGGRLPTADADNIREARQAVAR